MLAFSMHLHLLETVIWRYRHKMTLSSDPLLHKLASEELILVSSGGSD